MLGPTYETWLVNMVSWLVMILIGDKGVNICPEP